MVATDKEKEARCVFADVPLVIASSAISSMRLASARRAAVWSGSNAPIVVEHRERVDPLLHQTKRPLLNKDKGAVSGLRRQSPPPVNESAGGTPVSPALGVGREPKPPRRSPPDAIECAVPMDDDESVLATLPRMLLGFLGARGLDTAELAREAALGSMTWDDEEERVPRAKVDALWAAGVERTGDPALGIRLAEAMPPGNAGVVEFVAQSARTIGESLALVARYWRLLNSAVVMRVERDGPFARLVTVPKHLPHLARPWLDLTAMAFVQAGRRSTVRPHDPVEIRMPWPQVADPDPLEQALGVAVRHDAARFEIVLPAAFLDEPLIGANQQLKEVLERHAERAMVRLDELQAPQFLVRVREAIRSRLEHGDATLERIADALGTTPRTLQRTMRKHDRSLRQLVDEIRCEIARRELGGGTRTVTDVAFLLGFSETSAFDRAFRRWTGISPLEFRARARVRTL